MTEAACASRRREIVERDGTTARGERVRGRERTSRRCDGCTAPARFVADVASICGGYAHVSAAHGDLFEGLFHGRATPGDWTLVDAIVLRALRRSTLAGPASAHVRLRGFLLENGAYPDD